MMSSPATMPILILPANPLRRATSIDRVAASFGIHAAGVRDDFDVAFDEIGQNLFDHRHEVARVARARIARALLLHDRHRDLGQIVEPEIVDRTAPHLLDRGLKRVAPKALPFAILIVLSRVTLQGCGFGTGGGSSLASTSDWNPTRA